MTASMMVLSQQPASAAARAALESSAEALGHTEPPAFLTLAEAPALADVIQLADPWVVVAIDDASVNALRTAFTHTCSLDAPGQHAPVQEAAALAPDAPALVRGYALVAVPGFEACLDDLPAKRIAWQRLQAARCPHINW